LIIDQHYKRRIRLEGKLDETRGYMLAVRDAETGEAITGIQRVTIWCDVKRQTTTEVVYLECDKETGHVLKGTGPDGVNVRIAHLDNPEFEVTAMEI
jgi:hypothetical protein